MMTRKIVKRNAFEDTEPPKHICLKLQDRPYRHNNNNNNNCNCVVTQCGGYFTCIQNMKLVTNKFKSGGLHEKHVVATWNIGNRLSICL